MRTAVHAAQALRDAAPKAATDLQTDQALKIRQDVWANRIRCVIGVSFHCMDVQLIINGQPHPHFVNRRSGFNRAAFAIFEGISLGVCEVAFNSRKPAQ
jgi:hypothetical protein